MTRNRVPVVEDDNDGSSRFERLKRRAGHHKAKLDKKAIQLIEELTTKVNDLSTRCLGQSKIINRLVRLAPKDEVAKLREELKQLENIEVHP